MACERRPAQATHQLSLLPQPSELLQALAPLPPLSSCLRAAGRMRRLPLDGADCSSLGTCEHINGEQEHGSQCQVCAGTASARGDLLAWRVQLSWELSLSVQWRIQKDVALAKSWSPACLCTAPLLQPSGSSKSHCCPGLLSDILMNTQQRRSQITQNCLVLIYGAVSYHQASEQNNTWAENRALCTAAETMPAIPSVI